MTANLVTRRIFTTKSPTSKPLVNLLRLLCLTTAAMAAAADDGRYFQQEIAPLFQRHCLECHDRETQEGGLNLQDQITRGGDSGPVIVPGHADQSLLFELVSHAEMPPPESSQLDAVEIEKLQTWISAGAALPNGQTFPSVTADRIQAMLLLRCAVCHGATRQEGGLDLRTRESILRGGKSGPAAVPGNPDESLLLQKIASGEMAPARRLVQVSIKPITDAETALLTDWIAAGMPAPTADRGRENSDSEYTATEQSFWAFQTPQQAPPPSVNTTARVQTPIDNFVLQRLEQVGLSLAEPAPPDVLVRRLYINLTGLPPTWDQLQDVLQDPADDRISKLIDRLLESPHYGVRWGRYWLDAAGYADSEGAQNEDRVRPRLWRYRDYVIRSFNSDKPYDRFLQEQLAGDELAPWQDGVEIDAATADNLVATGFLRLTPDRTFANITAFVPDRLEVIADEMQVLGSAVMGLTVGCARCHNHKFDPISQADYYKLTAIFKDAFDEHDWLKSQGERTLAVVSTAERKQWEQQKQTLESRIAELQAQQQQADEETRKSLQQQIDAAKGSIPPEPQIRALWSRGRPSPTWVLLRGNYLTPGKRVQPDVPTIFAERYPLPQIAPPWQGAESTGRRLAFARWLTSDQHPLTARVMVNRIWMHHFGRGLVDTPANFGVTGSPPSHPLLLDWLAVEFVRSGWSIKSLHRLILNSAVWQQSSAVSQQSQELDPAGHLLSRAPLRRLDAESLRDSLLFVSGALSEQMYGPADPLDVRADGLVTVRATGDKWRRSIFAMMRRTQIPSLLETFDYPQMGPNCLQRSESTVAPQALQLLNSGEVHRLSARLAAVVLQDCQQSMPLTDDADLRKQRIIAVCRRCLSRQPGEQELHLFLQGLQELAAQWRQTGETAERAEQLAFANLCHAILNSASFVMVE